MTRGPENSIPAQLALDAGVSIAAIVALLLLAVWMLRRQASVVGVV